MTSALSTRGQLERSLSQRIQALYRNQVGHQPSRVICQILDDKLTIILEDSITQAEQVLVQEGQNELVEQVRSSLNEAIKPQMQAVIEEVLSVAVVDWLSDTTLTTGRVGVIVILGAAPSFREATVTSRTRTANGD